MKPLVIVGAGLAGHTLIREYRKRNPERPITLIAADGADFYAKPGLSNAFAQNKTANALVTQTAEQIAAQYQVSIRSHCKVLGIELAHQALRTSAGEFEYGDLVLAVGADPIRLSLNGKSAHEVLSINDLDDYRRFRLAIETAHTVCILGGGLIGSEFANDLALKGYVVTVVDPGDYPLGRLLPPEIGLGLQGALEAKSVEWKRQQTAVAVHPASVGKGFEVELSSGERIQADCVLSAVGLRPRIDLARQTGLATHRGIVTDAYLKTSQPNIFALGDCAEIEGQVRPYVQPILYAAKALAATLNGEPTPVDFPMMPVVVKTSVYPLAIQPPAPHDVGRWVLEQTDKGTAALFLTEAGELRGFALTHGRIQERTALAQKMLK